MKQICKHTVQFEQICILTRSLLGWSYKNTLYRSLISYNGIKSLKHNCFRTEIQWYAIYFAAYMDEINRPLNWHLLVIKIR